MYKSLFIRLGVRALALSLCFAALGAAPAMAAPIEIGTLDALTAHSARDASGMYWLKPGAYYSSGFLLESGSLGLGEGVEYSLNKYNSLALFLV